MRVYDSECLDTHKTKNLNEKFNRFLGNKEKAVFVTPKTENKNFMLAQESLKNVKVVNPNALNLLDLVVHDKLVFTVESLQEFTELFLAVAYQKEKPKWISDPVIDEFLNLNYKLKDQTPPPVFNPEEGFETNFAFLESYYEKYQEMMNQAEILNDEPEEQLNEENSQ